MEKRVGNLNYTAYQSLQNLFIIKENTTGSILEFLYNETPRLPNGTREISLDFTALTTSARLSINPFVGNKLYIQSFRIIQLPDAPAITPPAELVSTGITSPVLATSSGTNMNLSVGTSNSTIVTLTDTAKNLIFKPRIIPQAQYQLQFDIQWPAGSTQQQKIMQLQGISVAELNTNFTAGANTALVNFVGGAIDGGLKLTFGVQGVTISNIKYTVEGSPVVMADSARTIKDNYSASDTLWSRTVVNGNLVLAPNNSTAACTLSRQFTGLVVGRTYRLLIAVPNSGAPTTGTFANIIAEGSTTPMFTIEANLAWQTITSSNSNTNAPRSGYSQVNGTGLKEYYLIFKATTSTITINYLGAKTNANLGGRSLRHIKLIQEPVFEEYSENNLASGYRYGFNGKEKENILYNSSNTYDFGARLYDSRIGRWFGVDPKASAAPGWSPYRAFFCNPLRYSDPDGQWEWDATGNLVAQKGDNSYTMAKFLGTSQSNAMQMLKRGGVTANAKGVLNLKEGQSFSKGSLWVGTKSASGPVVNNTTEAKAHYDKGSGTAADVGDQSTIQLLDSDKFKTKLNKITSKKVVPTGFFAVDMTNFPGSFHLGSIGVDYSVTGNGTSSAVTFTLFTNTNKKSSNKSDGFWDPNFAAEWALGYVLDRYKADEMGPNLEWGDGVPYPYKTRERTFFFKPVK